MWLTALKIKSFTYELVAEVLDNGQWVEYPKDKAKANLVQQAREWLDYVKPRVIKVSGTTAIRSYANKIIYTFVKVYLFEETVCLK